MSEIDVKQVKVDNWGIYFLQRLKHFFNRTDYCDLTLQFQDNAQLKVHRLVLSACTEYFELLERTCEMYEDCLVMPDDLQADVVVPIVNFMYTGQLEFRIDILERMYQTSQIMNMTVLTKLLDAHRTQVQASQAPKPILNFTTAPVKRSYSKMPDKPKVNTPSSSNSSSKRSFQKAFGNTIVSPKKTLILSKKEVPVNFQREPSPPLIVNKKSLTEPRPTRYELPEELDTDNIFDDSFSNISYTSQPLMVHPESTRRYPSKKSNLFGETSSLKNSTRTSTLDIVQCKKIQNSDSTFEDDSEPLDEAVYHLNARNAAPRPSNQLFDQIVEQQDNHKITIETKDSKQAGNIDHAKIISEVLKKYPHLVKSNKNIKLKILNSPANTKAQNNKLVKKQKNSPTYREKPIKLEPESTDYTYESDVLDSKEAARLISLGAENVKGPWICLICGTPGRALHFTSYYKFRRHLVDVHNEKPLSNMCEYCGLKSYKRNYLLHHLLTKHGVEPPPAYKFPRCNQCNYIALTEGFLVKHKMTHTDVKSFRCNGCSAAYNSSQELLAHIQKTGHKYCADRRTNLQCVYCLKMFLRESNLYAHLKTHHRENAKADGIIDDSDEEREREVKPSIKLELPIEDESDSVEAQYQISPDGSIQLVSRKQQNEQLTPSKQKILNTGYKIPPKPQPQRAVSHTPEDFLQHTAVATAETHPQEVIMIDNNEYVLRDNKLMRKKKTDEYIVSDMLPEQDEEPMGANNAMEFSNIHDTLPEEQEQGMIIKKSNVSQPIQIVVSSEEEYKALMNANHSIIFDDGDANKTLTVLSTPQHAAINTASIDLDNSQPSDMMIINPENYPLNVSEALPTDNSNIVVVYSHPVDDQNKQFQIITSQDIGAQFVQSSAVLTPQYQALTTSSAVMGSHVIGNTMIGNWQSNIQGSQPINMAPNTIIEATEIVPVQTHVVDTINELPDVTLTPAVTEPAHSLQDNVIHESLIQNTNAAENIDTNIVQENATENIDTNIVQENATENIDTNIVQENATENIDPTGNIDTDIIQENPTGNIDTDIIQESEQEEQSDSTIPMEVDASSNVIDNTIMTNKTVIDDSLIQNSTPKEPEFNSDEQVIQGAHEAIEDIGEPAEVVHEENQLQDNTDNTENYASNTIEQTNEGQRIPVHDEEVTIPSITKEHLQNLTSEWSEDEEDAVNEPPVTEEVVQNNFRDTVPEQPAEIEESIENIQHEIAKDIPQVPKTVETTQTETIAQDDTTKVQDQSVNVLAEPVPEKISSLLNDWDENDSQEGNESANGIGEETTVPAELPDESGSITEVSPPSANVTHDSNNPNLPKDEKIKILVSDWDEEEEDQS